MKPKARPLNHRLDKIEASAAQVKSAVDKLSSAESDLIAITFVPETDDRKIREVWRMVGREKGAKRLDHHLIHNRHFTDLLIVLDASKTKRVLRTVVGSDPVRSAGPVVALGKQSLAYLTGELIVRIDDSVGDGLVFRKAARLGYRQWRQIPCVTPATYHLRAREHPGPKLLRHARELMTIDGVVAEPDLAGFAAPNAAARRELSSGLWDGEQIAGALQLEVYPPDTEDDPAVDQGDPRD